MSEFTSILFARPSFFEGFARSLDFGNTLMVYNSAESGEIADLRALAADWRAIGFDFKAAMEKVLCQDENLSEGQAGLKLRPNKRISQATREVQPASKR